MTFWAQGASEEVIEDAGTWTVSLEMLISWVWIWPGNLHFNYVSRCSQCWGSKDQETDWKWDCNRLKLTGSQNRDKSKSCILPWERMLRRWNKAQINSKVPGARFRTVTSQEEAEGRFHQPVVQLPGWKQLNFKRSLGFPRLWLWVGGWGTQRSWQKNWRTRRETEIWGEVNRLEIRALFRKAVGTLGNAFHICVFISTEL